MPMWRCPHCGTPQAETARCWVCRRSSTACGTCRHFRRSVAANLGFCGLDPARRPLAGEEIRPCWEAGPAVVDVLPRTTTPRPTTPFEEARPRRDFVEVTVAGASPQGRRRQRASAPAGAGPTHAAATATTGPAQPAPTPAPAGERWSLWGDAEV